MKSMNSLDIRVKILRQRLHDSKDLSAISKYFDDELLRDDFINQGISDENMCLTSIVAGVLKAVNGQSSPVDQHHTYVPKYHLRHGIFIFQSGMMAQYIYFDDANRGLCTVAQAGQSLCQFLRFSIPEEMTEAIDPQSLKLAGIAIRNHTAIPN